MTLSFRQILIFKLFILVFNSPLLFSKEPFPIWNISHSGIVYDFHPDYFENIYTDPILGEFLCRPLIRYNIQKNNYEFPLLKTVREFEQGSEWHWEFILRTELSWGSGEAFTSEDLKVLIEEFWPSRIEKLYGIILSQNVKITINDPHKLTIKWPSKPKIGPYVIGKIPVMKARELTKGFKAFNCVGRYKVDFSNENETHLIAKAKIPSGYPKKLTLLTKTSKDTSSDKNYDLILSFADELKPAHKRLSDESAKCSAFVLTPYLSILTWNPLKDISSTSQLRRVLTSSIPRGELLRAGAAFLGELSTGLLSKNSPAYSKNAELVPFDILKASKNFEALGFKRLQAFGPRMEKNGSSEIKLNITSSFEGYNLAKKIISDSFASLGIKVNFISPNQNKTSEDADGRMESIFLDSNYDYLLSYFDSSSSQKFPFFEVESTNLQNLISQFKGSLGQSSLDLDKLTEIHNTLIDLELASVFFQHKLCVQMNTRHPQYSSMSKLF